MATTRDKSPTDPAAVAAFLLNGRGLMRHVLTCTNSRCAQEYLSYYATPGPCSDACRMALARHVPDEEREHRRRRRNLALFEERQAQAAREAVRAWGAGWAEPGPSGLEGEWRARESREARLRTTAQLAEAVTEARILELRLGADLAEHLGEIHREGSVKGRPFIDPGMRRATRERFTCRCGACVSVLDVEAHDCERWLPKEHPTEDRLDGLRQEHERRALRVARRAAELDRASARQGTDDAGRWGDLRHPGGAPDRVVRR